MRIRVIAIGRRMPRWVEQGYREYAKRLPQQCRLELVEVPAAKRTRTTDLKRAMREDSERLLMATPDTSRVVLFDRQGAPLTTQRLVQALQQWMMEGRDVALLIGGPDGLGHECRCRADHVWSLSGLTLAHPIARVVVAEQMYRAWSILQGLPYHRD